MQPCQKGSTGPGTRAGGPISRHDDCGKACYPRPVMCALPPPATPTESAGAPLSGPGTGAGGPRLLSRVLIASGSALILAGVVGCLAQAGKPVPDDGPRFPTGVALSPDGDRLVVIGSNFDLAFDSGALFAADVGALREGFTDKDTVFADPWTGFVAVPSFADKPVFDSTGRHLFMTSKGQNLLHVIDVSDDVTGDDALRCAGEVCNQGPDVLQLPQNDPTDVVLLDGTFNGDTLTAIRGLVTHLSSPEVQLFTFRPDRTDDTRLQFESSPITLDGDAFGVRSVGVRRDPDGAAGRIIFGTEDRIDGVVTDNRLVIAPLPAENRGDQATFSATSITALTGTRSMREFVVLDGDDDDHFVLLATLRVPDGLARFEVDERTNAVSLTHLTSSCKGPQSMQVTRGPDGAAGVVLTCTESQAVQVIDPRTLQVEGSVRFFGRSPYAVAVDDVHQLAYISFHADNSVGVFALRDAEGAPDLRPVGRLGKPLPRPEDGRE